jgi:hypothetical protein
MVEQVMLKTDIKVKHGDEEQEITLLITKEAIGNKVRYTVWQFADWWIEE